MHILSAWLHERFTRGLSLGSDACGGNTQCFRRLRYYHQHEAWKLWLISQRAFDPHPLVLFLFSSFNTPPPHPSPHHPPGPSRHRPSPAFHLPCWCSFHDKFCDSYCSSYPLATCITSKSTYFPTIINISLCVSACVSVQTGGWVVFLLSFERARARVCVCVFAC